MIDQKTPNYGWPLVHPDNDQEHDLPRLVATLLAIDGGMHLLQQFMVAMGEAAQATHQLAEAALPANANAVSATKLKTARRINGVLFNGTADIEINSGEYVAVVAAANVAIEHLAHALITNAAASINVALPAAPEVGQRVMLTNLTARLDHRLLVGTVPIKGRATGGYITFDKAHHTVLLRYISADYGWEVI